MNKLSLGQKINKFDMLEKNTVKEFNKIFKEFPIDYIPENDKIVIGQCSGNCFRREIKANGEVYYHEFYKSEQVEEIDQDTFLSGSDYIDLSQAFRGNNRIANED